MKFQLITALVVLPTTLLGVLVFPAPMATAIAVIGIGCSVLSVVFALIIAKSEGF